MGVKEMFHSPQREAEDGARLLDEVQPGWAAHIDRSTLDIGHECRCVLAQVSGRSYTEARLQLELDPVGAKKHGLFVLGKQSDPFVRRRYRQLTQHWGHEVEKRQSAAVAA